MGTATARVESGSYPKWMAMVSSCIGSDPSCGGPGQPVGVQTCGRIAPRPAGAGADRVERIGLDQRRLALRSGDGVVQLRQPRPVIGSYAVDGQDRELVALV